MALVEAAVPDDRPLWFLTPEPWAAEVCRSEHIGYWISFTSGLMGETRTYFRWTQRGAVRCSRRGVARRNAADRRTSRRWVIRDEDA